MRSSSAPTSLAPQNLPGCGGHEGFHELHEPSDQPERPLTECELGTAGCAEEIRDQREVGALDVAEDQRRTARGDHAPMDLRGLEIRVDRCGHLDDVARAAKDVDERAEVGDAHAGGTLEVYPSPGRTPLPAGYPCQA